MQKKPYLALFVALIASVSLANGSLAQSVVPAAAQQSAVHVTVTAASTGQVLGFALVAIPTLGLERFSSERGQLTFPQIPVGTYRMRVRQLGYEPFETTVVVKSGTMSEVVVHMTRISQTLEAMQVEADWRCEKPGRPPASNKRAVAAFEQMEQNAERLRLLREQYPYNVYVERWRLLVRTDGSDSTTLRDTIITASDSQTKYAPGNVVYNRNKEKNWEYYMRIPTLAVFADDIFEKNHCFVVRGVDKTKGNMLRIDFKTFYKVKTPDVEGSVFLDTSSFRLMRSEVKLTTLPKNLTGISSVSVVALFTEVSPGLPITGAVDAVTQLNTFNYGNNFFVEVEKQAPVRVDFLKGRPGGVKKDSVVKNH